MPVKSFKFVSPGVFINEIDNSFRPRRPEAIGPVIVGRSVRGLAMQPVKLESFSDFLTMYGDTVPGNGGGDIYRDGNYQSPMYGTYAAKAFLNASVAPVTYMRLLGSQHDSATADGKAGWQTTKNPTTETFSQLKISLAHPAPATGSLIQISASGDIGGSADGCYRLKFTDAASDTTFGSVSGVNGFRLANIDNRNNVNQIAADIVTVIRSMSTASSTVNDIKNFSAFSSSAQGAVIIHSNRAAGQVYGSKRIFASASITPALTNTTLTVTSGLSNRAESGGAYGLWVFPSSSIGSGKSTPDGAANQNIIGTGSLAAVWYIDQSSSIQLSGNLAGTSRKAEGIGMVIEGDSGLFTVSIKNSKPSDNTDEKISFNFDDSDQRFIRKVFNTNPQLVEGGTFYDRSLERNYWLGESFEQEVRDGAIGSITGSATAVSSNLFGVILPIRNGSNGPNTMRRASTEAQTGWVIGQSREAPAAFVPTQADKLFQLKGRGHGEWLSKNVKISIEKIRYSSTNTTDYGTFSVVLRSITDTDSNPVILERFDNLTLDPRSPNYISRKIGDKYYKWNESERRLREYGEYPNQSKFLYVSEIRGDINPTSVPFGYYGPPNFAEVTNWSGSVTDVAVAGAASYVEVTKTYGSGYSAGGSAGAVTDGGLLSGAFGQMTATLKWPTVRLRHSASDGGLADQTDAYFGMQTTTTVGGTIGDLSVKDYHRRWINADGNWGTGTGLAEFSYIFTMDDIKEDTTNGQYFYSSGSRVAGTSVTSGSYKDLIDAGIDKFTMPLWGGFDGFDITKPDPMFNNGMASTATDLNSYIFNTYKRAIDTVADPEFVDMNLLAVPGLTKEGLTTQMIDVCEARADALALIDLPDVYLPNHEVYKADITDRQPNSPTQAATALRQRQIDSSYGATFYPWVQTTDEGTGQALWVPPTVAMMGVLASSERASQIWFAPAGFNRGGLSDGAAGIPITSVSRRLTSKERDTLYESRINPIASFPSTGIVVFGQKTLQERPSALDRINVRRLVIFLKKQISILSTQILFEQNVQATWNRFKGLIEPFLANVKTQFGITDYRLILDESTTTPDLVDQNVVYAKIMIKPARAIEYIAIDFIVASTGASFDD